MRIHALFGAITILTLHSIVAIPSQNTFSIYLIEGTLEPTALIRDQGSWKDAKLSTKAVISEADIIDYDFSKHAMRLNPETIKRLPKPGVKGTPFVVIVNGERIYLGAFYSLISSITCTAPVIVIDRGIRDSEQKGDTLFIERAYPPDKGVGQDMRSDERIETVLGKLEKLREL
ncbi:MAG TPA: hypothetical protein VJ810_41155 [Blastocatellia bacterium]|nr:hypothetical protein [Blastocatellia bacterium]